MAAGLSLRGGSRGSLTRCLGRLAAAAAADTNDANARAALRRELQSTRVELTKLALQVQRQRAEYQQLLVLCRDNDTNNTNNDNDAVAKARGAVQALRLRHQDAIATKACKAEYEALAKICATRYPVPRRMLQQSMQTAAAQKELETHESHTLTAHTRVREKQFASLMQGLADLKQSLVAESLELMAHEMPTAAAAADVNNHNNNNNATNRKSTDTDNINAMQVDDDMPDKQPHADGNNNNKQDHDDEEGALYEDL